MIGSPDLRGFDRLAARWADFTSRGSGIVGREATIDDALPMKSFPARRVQHP
jgi:hypothetical protein